MSLTCDMPNTLMFTMDIVKKSLMNYFGPVSPSFDFRSLMRFLNTKFCPLPETLMISPYLLQRFLKLNVLMSFPFCEKTYCSVDEKSRQTIDVKESFIFLWTFPSSPLNSKANLFFTAFTFS